MITRTAELRQTPRWQRELARAIRDPATLLRMLELDPERAGFGAARPEVLLEDTGTFGLRVPRGYVARMRKGDPADPLLLQVLPQVAERMDAAGFVPDPVGDGPARQPGGWLHKYAGRALLITTGACPIHCRYCFRRHFPYTEHQPAGTDWAQSLQYLRDHPDITEVILSGGDPLSLTDRRLADMLKSLQSLPQLRRIRLHSRFPVVLPERIDDELLTWVRACRLPLVLVIHANHAREIDAGVLQALQGLRQAGVTLLNQAVLLRSINDTVEAQVQLAEALFAGGVLPYYLHCLDRVQGAAHFEVPQVQAQALMAQLSRRLPGYLLPRLVREEAGRPSKTILFTNDYDPK